jgi:hypothetical protein
MVMDFIFKQDIPELDDLVMAYESEDSLFLDNTWRAIADNNFPDFNQDMINVRQYYEMDNTFDHIQDLLNENASQLNLQGEPEEVEHNLDNYKDDLNYSDLTGKQSFDMTTAHIEMFENHLFNFQRLGDLCAVFKEYIQEHDNTISDSAMTATIIMQQTLNTLENVSRTIMHNLDQIQMKQTDSLNNIHQMQQDLGQQRRTPGF